MATSLRLLRRQFELDRQRRQPGGISALEERELFAIRTQLEEFPAAVAAITQLSGATRKALDQICVEDIEGWDDRRAS